MDVEQIRRRHEDRLLAIPDVTGVGTSKEDSGRDVIVVYVARMESVTDRGSGGIPPDLDGFPVHILEIGFPTAQ